MPKSNLLLQAVKEILFLEWDPIGVNDHEGCLNEYDNYAVSIWKLLRADADEHKLAQYLTRAKRENVGLSRIDVEHDRHIARRLLALKIKANH